MKIRIKKIPISLAQSGMTLGAPVLDQQNRILLAAGLELTEDTVNGLRRHDILCISILEEDDRSEAELAVEREQMAEHVNELFRKGDQTANQELLHQLILEYRLEALL